MHYILIKVQNNLKIEEAVLTFGNKRRVFLSKSVLSADYNNAVPLKYHNQRSMCDDVKCVSYLSLEVLVIVSEVALMSPE